MFVGTCSRAVLLGGESGFSQQGRDSFHSLPTRRYLHPGSFFYLRAMFQLRMSCRFFVTCDLRRDVLRLSIASVPLSRLVVVGDSLILVIVPSALRNRGDPIASRNGERYLVRVLVSPVISRRVEGQYSALSPISGFLRVYRASLFLSVCSNCGLISSVSTRHPMTGLVSVHVSRVNGGLVANLLSVNSISPFGILCVYRRRVGVLVHVGTRRHLYVVRGNLSSVGPYGVVVFRD